MKSLQVVFKALISPSNFPVEENLFTSTIPKFKKRAKELEDEVIQRLNNGDIWAWFDVYLEGAIALDNGKKIIASTTLGWGSYDDEEDFRNWGLGEMIDEVLSGLRKMLKKN